MYTLVYDKFHTSGQQEEGGQEFEDSIEATQSFASHGFSIGASSALLAVLHEIEMFKV